MQPPLHPRTYQRKVPDRPRFLDVPSRISFVDPRRHRVLQHRTAQDALAFDQHERRQDIQSKRDRLETIYEYVSMQHLETALAEAAANPHPLQKETCLTVVDLQQVCEPYIVHRRVEI